SPPLPSSRPRVVISPVDVNTFIFVFIMFQGQQYYISMNNNTAHYNYFYMGRAHSRIKMIM
ncbi:hypothetical protein MWK26_21520, partial [Escherichia coli]|nr:hypothetical protein [Escherichia coli]